MFSVALICPLLEKDSFIEKKIYCIVSLNVFSVLQMALTALRLVVYTYCHAGCCLDQ